LGLGDLGEDARDERKEILESVARRDQEDDAEPRPNEILLELEVSVRRNENLEALVSRTAE
jgi:hypothetical protein